MPPASRLRPGGLAVGSRACEVARLGISALVAAVFRFGQLSLGFGLIYGPSWTYGRTQYLGGSWLTNSRKLAASRGTYVVSLAPAGGPRRNARCDGDSRYDVTRHA
jgi:hypothetical protein